MNSKLKPIEERVAEIFGKAGYRDIRDGIGGSLQLNHSDVAHALGKVCGSAGQLPVMAMETHYGRTLMHEVPLRKAWESFCGSVDPHQDRQTKTLSRLSCALAVRELAGSRHTSRDLDDYAWMIVTHRRVLEAAIRLSGSWLDELLMTGVTSLRSMLRSRAA
jgi:hypothetical protein